MTTKQTKKIEESNHTDNNELEDDEITCPSTWTCTRHYEFKVDGVCPICLEEMEKEDNEI